MYYANDWSSGRWVCLTTGMLYGPCSSPSRCPSFSETTKTPGNQHQSTVTSVSSSAMWGTSAAVAFTCYSPQVAPWDHVNWASTFPPPSNHWILGLLYLVNLGCPVTFAQAPSRKPELALVPRFPRLRKTRPTLFPLYLSLSP